jgi:hypothetical protein
MKRGRHTEFRRLLHARDIKNRDPIQKLTNQSKQTNPNMTKHTSSAKASMSRVKICGLRATQSAWVAFPTVTKSEPRNTEFTSSSLNKRSASYVV